MKTTMQSRLIYVLVLSLLAGSLLLSACSPAPKQLTAEAVPVTEGGFSFSMDFRSIATGSNTETVAAVSSASNAPYWEVLPAYTRITLQGYPVSNSLLQPQIFIYPVKDLSTTNEGAGQVASSLKMLLQFPQEIANMPFLPLVNAVQVMHTHLQYLDFKSGKGLRYLTQFNQGIEPINNSELIYTYQGLTSDGKYYVAAVLPVDGKITGQEPAEFTTDYRAFIANVAQALNVQADNTFTPDLTRLDAMLSSLEIK